MKIFNIDGETVNVDVRQSKYPIKQSSRSKRQHSVGEILIKQFPRAIILEEFTIPGSRMSVDYFLPHEDLVVEVNGEGHQSYHPRFHSDRNLGKFAKQVSHDRRKQEWAETNGFKFVTIDPEDDDDTIRDRISDV